MSENKSQASIEENDEFEVIQSLEGEEDLIQLNDPKVVYFDKSSNVSEMGPEAIIESDGMDFGKSICSSTSQNVFDSMYSFHQPGDYKNIEKMVGVLCDGQNKNQNMLEQMMKIVLNLNQEKDNAELRSELAAQEDQLKEQRKKNKDLEEEARLLKDKINDLSVHGEYLNSSIKVYNDLITKLRKKNEELKDDNERTKDVVNVMEEQLMKNETDLSNNTEIIKILQEENLSLHEALERNRKTYRLNLDSLEQRILLQRGWDNE